VSCGAATPGPGWSGACPIIATEFLNEYTQLSKRLPQIKASHAQADIEQQLAYFRFVNNF
jgi:hypothetical protein